MKKPRGFLAAYKPRPLVSQQSRLPSCSPQVPSVLTELQAEAQEGQQPSQGQQHQEAITVKHYCLFYLLFMASPPTRNLSCGENKSKEQCSRRKRSPSPGKEAWIPTGEQPLALEVTVPREIQVRTRESASTPLTCRRLARRLFRDNGPEKHKERSWSMHNAADSKPCTRTSYPIITSNLSIFSFLVNHLSR